MKPIVLALIAAFLAIEVDAKETDLNPAHDTLQKQDLTSRKRTLGKLLEASGNECAGVTKTYYQGFDENKAAYWNARCRGGIEYLLQFPQSKFENIRILKCENLAASGVQCFKKSDRLRKR